jgi:hypothetical protein
MRSESTSFHQSAFAGASGAMKNRVAHKDPFITSAGGTKSYVYDTCQVRAPRASSSRSIFRLGPLPPPLHLSLVSSLPACALPLRRPALSRVSLLSPLPRR